MLEERRTMASTTKLVAEVEAEGEKKAKEIEATTEKLIAEIDAKTASFAAQTTTTLGEAAAKSIELVREAEADRFRQYVKALGVPTPTTASSSPKGCRTKLRLGVFYAGPGRSGPTSRASSKPCWARSPPRSPTPRVERPQIAPASGPGR